MVKGEKYRRQRSQIYWLSKGDRNTKFFHLSLVVHGQWNSILKLRKRDRGQTMNEVEVQHEILGYYKDLFMHHKCPRIGKYFMNIHPLVRLEQNQDLIAEVSPQEIWNVVFSIGPYKALRVDAYNSYFYRQIGRSLEGRSLRLCSNFLRLGGC